MSNNSLSKADILEALLFASEAPLALEKIAQILEASEEQAREELEVLREEKLRIGGLQVVEVAGGWQMLTKAEVAPYVARLREAPRQKLSRAAFEVLAVVAYRQPITRSEIEELRGVDCSRPLTFLLDKKLLHFAGRKEAPGRPWLYETSPHFLENFGLRTIADLPPLSELAELNDAALDGRAQQLFSRGPMQAEVEHSELDEEKNEEDVTSETVSLEVREEWVEDANVQTEDIIEESVATEDTVEDDVVEAEDRTDEDNTESETDE
jgi:segregation and condensation protein B